MLKDKLIENFKNKRKQGFLDLPDAYQSQYAFIGVGAHSIMNLYPCISYLAIPLKYIVTKNGINGAKMAKRFQNCTGTTDLKQVLNDPDVKAVFICSNPDLHFTLALECLEAGKHVFVEKPVCKTLSEFEKLEKAAASKNLLCAVGLQKRFATVYKQLKSKIGQEVVTYNLQYKTGSYPEGNEILDLFVHPIDLSVFLFGKITDIKKSYHKTSAGNTLFLMATHANGSKGVMELSTAYSWNQANESLTVNTASAVFETSGMRILTQTAKPGVILGIPMEKLRKQTPKVQILFENTGFLPVESYNPLKTNGYYDEIKTFAAFVEGHQSTAEHSLSEVRESWRIIEELMKG